MTQHFHMALNSGGLEIERCVDLTTRASQGGRSE